MSTGLAIVGYGKMGRLIEQLAPEYGFDVRAKFDARNNPRGQALSQQTLRGVDAAVEFTSPTLLRKISAASLHWALTRLSAQPAGSIIFPRSAKLWQAAERALFWAPIFLLA